MSALNLILTKLDNPKQYGKRWRARCPACNSSRDDVLVVSEANNGGVVLHCHAGCEKADVLAAMGLTFSDLFPERLPERHVDETPAERAARKRAERERRRDAALRSLREDVHVIVYAQRQLAAGMPLNVHDRARLELAGRRFIAAAPELGVRFRPNEKQIQEVQG